MKFKKVVLVVLLFTFVLLNSCATILRSNTKIVPINSSPKNAKVTIKNQAGVTIMSGNTPMITQLKKGQRYVITVELEGYQPATIDLSRQIDPVTCTNLFFCYYSVFGFLVDFFSGSFFTISPSSVSVLLIENDQLHGRNQQQDTYIKMTMNDSNHDSKTIQIDIKK